MNTTPRVVLPAYIMDKSNVMLQEDLVVESRDMSDEGWDTHKHDDPAKPLSTTLLFSKVPICLYFLKGTCIFGEGCDFKHPENVLVEPPPVPYCQFYQKGRCKYGEKCIYRHILFKSEKVEKVNMPSPVTTKSTETLPEPQQISLPPLSTIIPSSPQKKKKSNVEICEECGAFYMEHCAFCEDESEETK